MRAEVRYDIYASNYRGSQHGTHRVHVLGTLGRRYGGLIAPLRARTMFIVWVM